MNREKEELIEKIEELLGRSNPAASNSFLKVLVHPDIIEYTKRYVESMDHANRCTVYIHPWSCVREAEARYENIKYGWLGGGHGVGYSEWWCENCRRKVMEK